MEEKSNKLMCKTFDEQIKKDENVNFILIYYVDYFFLSQILRDNPLPLPKLIHKYKLGTLLRRLQLLIGILR